MLLSRSTVGNDAGAASGGGDEPNCTAGVLARDLSWSLSLMRTSARPPSGKDERVP